MLEALIEGVYEGDLTYQELKKHGDFGLGTFNGLDGEMVALDGVFYRVDYEGNVSIVDDNMKSPFANCHFLLSTNEKLVPKQQLSCEAASEIY